MGTFFNRKDDYGYIRWASEVKRRDHYTCVICGRRGVALNSHHLNAWASHPTERYDVSNGATLCSFHHEDFHSKYGKGKNTKEQFEEYRVIAEALIKVANEESLLEATARRMLQQVQKDYAVTEILKDLEDKYGTEKSGEESGEVDTSSDTSI
jgi:hypothetical protein